jgi:hypothetical protein
MPTNYKTNVVLCKLYDLVRSPIELIFGIAIFDKLSTYGRCQVYSDREYRKLVSSLNEGDRHGSFALVSNFLIHSEIGEVDFAVFLPDLSPTHPLAVVECDGHEFHERTVAQASWDKRRDRMIQSLGVPVIAFYRD